MRFDDEDRSRKQRDTDGPIWVPNGLDLSKARAQALARNGGKFSKGVKETSSTPTLHAKPGYVELEQLTNYDWKKQLTEFIKQYGRCRANDFSRKCSEDTLIDRQTVLFSTIAEVMKERHLKTLSQVRPRLLPLMFELWSKRPVTKRVQVNYYTNMRWFWRICGIEIPPISEYATSPKEFTVNRNATRDKSWSGNGVDYDEVYAAIYAFDPIAARIVAAMKTYGLRLKEALCLRPHAADDRDALSITQGTKTGRPRQLQFDKFNDDKFRSVLDDLKEEVPEGCHIAWQNRNLKAAKEHMAYIARRFGITMAQRGVTWHGLRHDWAITNLEKLTGLPAPVRGGLLINYKAISQARLEVSQALGHGRAHIVGAYIGGPQSANSEGVRATIRSFEKIQVCLRDVGKLLVDNGIYDLYWIGDRASGGNDTSLPFQFAFPDGVDVDVSLKLAPEICEKVEMSTGLACSVILWKTQSAKEQAKWSNAAVSLFMKVSPLEYMQAVEQELGKQKRQSK